MMRFDFEARQHAGNMHGAAMQCHNVYRVGSILVTVQSSGRSHRGSITFKFKNQKGLACTAADWAAEHQEPWLYMTVVSERRQQPMSFHGAPDVHISTYQGPGVEIELSTYGRNHDSSFTVAPIAHLVQVAAASLTTCAECDTVGLLPAEQPLAAAAQAGLQANAAVPVGVQQYVAAM